MSFSIFSSLPIWREKCYLVVASLSYPQIPFVVVHLFEYLLAISISWFVNSFSCLLPKFLIAFPSYLLHIHFHMCYLEHSNLIYSNFRMFYTAVKFNALIIILPYSIWSYHFHHQKNEPFLKEKKTSFVNYKLNY